MAAPLNTEDSRDSSDSITNNIAIDPSLLIDKD